MGLAAPQVGVNVRMIVFNETGDKEKKESEVVLVNPRVITASKDAKVFEEGCLSFPATYGDVVVSSVQPGEVLWRGGGGPCADLNIAENYHYSHITLLLLAPQRPTKVRVRAQDLSGKSFVINIGGFPARIFQHEYDHLQVRTANRTTIKSSSCTLNTALEQHKDLMGCMFCE